jgi:hypothetical protein
MTNIFVKVESIYVFCRIDQSNMCISSCSENSIPAVHTRTTIATCPVIFHSMKSVLLNRCACVFDRDGKKFFSRDLLTHLPAYINTSF